MCFSAQFVKSVIFYSSFLYYLTCFGCLVADFSKERRLKAWFSIVHFYVKQLNLFFSKLFIFSSICLSLCILTGLSRTLPSLLKRIRKQKLAPYARSSALPAGGNRFVVFLSVAIVRTVPKIKRRNGHIHHFTFSMRFFIRFIWRLTVPSEMRVRSRETAKTGSIANLR